MKILRMQATFGCLDEAVLELQGGCQVLTLPNEQGKSTWAAFLLAMFYGIDTAQRAVKGRLPEKTRYLPWNGKEMAGRVELEHGGRTLILQRTSARGKPLGVLQVYDKETGLILPEITAENCGTYFLGVERSVFQRSAFLSGEELAVSQDETLARRLENLAASGDSKENYPAAAAKLRQWKNRVHYHQSGLLPEAEGRLQETLRQLESLASAEENLRRARQQETESRRQTAGAEEAERRQWQAEQEAAREAFARAQENWERISKENTAGSVEQAQQALTDYERLTAGRKKAALLPVGALAAAALALLFRVKPLWCGVGLALLLIPTLALWLRARTLDKKDKAAAEEILRQWKVGDKNSLIPMAVEESRRRDEALSLLRQAQTAAEAASRPYRLSPSLQAAKDQASFWQMEAERLASRLQVLGEPERLRRRAEELTGQVQTLKKQEAALAMAQRALDGAEQMQAQVYAPRLTKLAGEYLSRLTAGRYDTVVLERGFALQAGESESGLLRPAGVLSTGTRDQLWLALRLAMTRLLLPEDVPIWLDDALLTFDEGRRRQAMELLETEDRQVIVMQCR